MLKNYFIIALRNMLKYKATSLINILGLAIGMAACILITIYVQYELSYDKFNANADNIYRLIIPVGDPKYLTDSGTPIAAGRAIKNNVPDFPKTTRIMGSKILSSIAYKDKTFKETKIKQVDPDILDMFDFEFIRGNKEHALSEPYSIVINEEIAARYFINEDPIGKVVKTGDKYFTVTGVIKKMPSNSTLQINAMVPLSAFNSELKIFENSWFNNLAETYVLAQSKLTVSQLEEKLYNTFYKNFTEEDRKTLSFKLQPLKRIHLYSKTDLNIEGGGDYSVTVIYGLLALFILLIACINFTNLSIGRLTTRFKEIGVRKLMGAQKRQILFQFWGEMVALCIIAFIIAMITAVYYLPYFGELTKRALSFSFSIWNILFFITIFSVTCLVAGSFPAIMFTRYQSAVILRGNVKLGGSNVFTKSLIVIQYALTLFFIICTSIMSSQISTIYQNHKIQDNEKIIRVNFNSIYSSDDKRTKRKLYLNEVTGNSIIQITAEQTGRATYGEIECDGKKWNGGIGYYADKYFDLFNVKITEGRSCDFTKYPSDSSSAALINESFVKGNNIVNPVGKSLRVLGKDYTIIGVVENEISSLKRKVSPVVYVNSNMGAGCIYCKVKNNDIQPVIMFLKDKWQSIFPGVVFNYSFYDEDVLEKYAQELTDRKLLSIVSIITLILSCLGLFGLTTLTIARRTKEIGVRKVLGASAGRIVSLLTGEMLLLIILAAVIASPLAYYYMHNWLDDYYYRINITAAYFVFAIAITIGVTLLVVGVKTAKAALANPVESIKCE
jgi:putative ABC transport system permease protein